MITVVLEAKTIICCGLGQRRSIATHPLIVPEARVREHGMIAHPKAIVYHVNLQFDHELGVSQ